MLLQVTISSYGIPHPNYQCITVLRCLYQRDHNPKLWAKLQALESHNEDRRGTEKWINDRKMIAEFIWKFFKLDGTFNEDEIMRCCGIVQASYRIFVNTKLQAEIDVYKKIIMDSNLTKYQIF